MAFKWKFNIISGDWEWIDEETNYSLDQNGYAYSLPEFNKEDKDDEDDFSFPGFESLIYENDDSGLDTYYDDDEF